jgi:hypothetical protein
MAEVLAKVDKVVVSPSVAGKTLPLLPLGGSSSTTPLPTGKGGGK